MSRLSSERMLKLMAYADDELSAEERTEVESWLASDVDAARFTNELATLGVLVEAGHRESKTASTIASFDVVDAVMASVEREKGVKPASVVTSFDAARARRARSLKVGGIVAGALALAASFMVVARTKEDAPMARAPSVQPSPSTSAEPGVDVDLVESAGESVRVFYLSNEGSSPTTSVVVWVDEPGGK